MTNNPTEITPTAELRFVWRDSPLQGEQRVLQQRCIIVDDKGTRFEWIDVRYVPPAQENAE